MESGDVKLSYLDDEQAMLWDDIDERAESESEVFDQRDLTVDFAVHAEREFLMSNFPFTDKEKEHLFGFYMLVNFKMHVHLNNTSEQIFITGERVI
jgi:hypothetical protein